jgi:hypothetical protein
MIVKVRMLAFENGENEHLTDGKYRLVTVPDEEFGYCLATKDIDPNWFENYILDRVFYWGQNDFQPQQICSVSMGDVVEHEGRYFLCLDIGWEEINVQTLESYDKLERIDRSLLLMKYGTLRQRLMDDDDVYLYEMLSLNTLEEVLEIIKNRKQLNHDN